MAARSVCWECYGSAGDGGRKDTPRWAQDKVAMMQVEGISSDNTLTIWKWACLEFNSFQCSEQTVNFLPFLKPHSLLRCTNTLIGKCLEKPTRSPAWE